MGDYIVRAMSADGFVKAAAIRSTGQPVTLEVDGSSPFRVAIFKASEPSIRSSHASVAQ